MASDIQSCTFSTPLAIVHETRPLRRRFATGKANKPCSRCRLTAASALDARRAQLSDCLWTKSCLHCLRMWSTLEQSESATIRLGVVSAGQHHYWKPIGVRTLFQQTCWRTNCLQTVCWKILENQWFPISLSKY